MGGYRVMDGEFSGKGMVFGMPEQKEEVHHYHHKASQENTSMNGDIAGLLALMQGNKGMDLPGLLALCKDKGYAKFSVFVASIPGLVVRECEDGITRAYYEG